MAQRSAAKGPLLLTIFIIIGLAAGALLSQLLRPYLPFLAKGVGIGFAPQALMLGDVFSFTIGFKLRLDVATMAGLITALILYWRI